MKRIDISLHNGELEFQFLNGILKLREDDYGAYAICPGCGSGKTTNIRDLISLKWYEGVLYSSFTKEECNKMYQYCKNLVGSRGPNGELLKLEDIIVLHSDYTAEGTDNNLWRNKTHELADKRIIICTHAKLLNEPLEILLNSNFNRKLSDIIGPIRAASTVCGGNLPRQWILVDEMTESNIIINRINKSSLFGMGKIVYDKKVAVYNEETGITTYKTVALPKPMMIRDINSYYEFKEHLKLYSEMCTDFSSIFKPEKCELDKLRNSQVCQSLYYNYEEYVNSSKDTNVSVSYSYTSMIHPDMNTHLLLFDGTSDITLKDSKKFKLLTYQNKYNSKVSINKFSFPLIRKLKPNLSEDMELYLRDKLNKVVDSLENIIRQNNKTLIFTWKNFKSDNSEVNDDVDESNITGISRSLNINPKLDLTRYIAIELNNRGLIEGDNYSIEYYGSGRDKAINDYREYDAVILAGRYQVPNNVITDFNLINNTNITGVEYYANRVVQAICRTRIRLHNRQGINAYFSDDWDRSIIDYVDEYLNNGKKSYSIPNISDDIVTRLRNLGITPKKAIKLSKLCGYDMNILTAMERGLLYKTEIDLETLYNILPMSRKRVSEYSSIILSLNLYGIELKIV